MNLDYAGTIPLRDILEKIGLKPMAADRYHSFLLASLDSQQTSLEVDYRNNTWRDAATRNGSGPFELVQAWLLHQGQPCTEKDVLHWLRFNIGYPSLVTRFGLSDGTPCSNYELVSKTGLEERALIRYVLRKGMTQEQAKATFKQVRVRDRTTGKEFRALGLRNEDGGYAIYSPHVAEMIAPAAISFVRGREHKPAGVHVFKTIFDYCEAIYSRGGKPFDHDSIILHAYGCADDAANYIRAYGYEQLHSWFDDSEQGMRATEAFGWLCATEPDMRHFVLRASA